MASIPTFMFANTQTNEQAPVCVEVTTSGTLSTLISADKKYSIKSLSVSGEIDGDDLRFLREMAGISVTGEKTEGTLETLDLTNANFVDGGGCFYEKDKYNKAAAIANTVNSHCFENSTLKEIKLPQSIRSIKSDAFIGSTKLENISIPSDVTEIGGNAFSGCCSLKTFDFPNVSKIEGDVLANCSSLTKITIPATVTELSYGMFQGCSALTEIHIAATSLPNKGWSPFSGIDQSKITLFVPAGYVELYNADSDWAKFKEIKEDGASSESGSKTYNVETAGTLSSLIGDAKNIITSMKVTGQLNGTDILCIREMAGRDKVGNQTIGKLTDLDLSEANIVAGGDAYFNMYNNEMGTNDNVISEYMFDHCNLTSFVFPTTVTAIEGGAFGSCYNLSGTITVPDNITRIANYAFEACVSVEHFNLPSKLSDGQGYGKWAIGTNAFSGCHSLKDLVVPDGVKRITSNMCNDCIELTDVVLPSTVNYIDGSSFKGCTKLTSIHIQATTPPYMGWGAFDENILQTCTVYVPKGTVDAYKAKSGWSDFANIIEDQATNIDKTISSTTTAADGVYNINGIKMPDGKLPTGIYVYKRNGKSVKFVKK